MIKPSSVNMILGSMLIAAAAVLICGRAGNAQTIGLSPPISAVRSGTPDADVDSVTDFDVLSFSTVTANELNSIRNTEILDYVAPSMVVDDPSNVTLDTHPGLIQEDASWWPRFNTSTLAAADLMTASLSSQFSPPGLARSFVETPKDAVGMQAGVESLYPPMGARSDGEFTDAGIRGESVTGSGTGSVLFAGGAHFLLGQSPLNSPEPGAIALLVALIMVPAMFAASGRLRTRGFHTRASVTTQSPQP